MKRIAMALAILLCGAVGGAQAHGYHHGPGHHYSYYPHNRSVVVVRPSVWINPPLVVPSYSPLYNYGNYGCYDRYPASGFYYRSRGLSIGVGF